MQHYKRAFIIFLLIGWSITIQAQTQSIILGRPTDTSITASIVFDFGCQYYIEFGQSTALYTRTTQTFTHVANIPDEIDLNGLTANTRYFYRLNYRRTGTLNYISTPEYSFITKRNPGSTYCFTLEADEHLYDKKGVESMYRITLNNQALDKPDFMLSLGDIFGDDHYPTTITAGQLDTLHKNYRPFLGAICHSIPFYVCLGNHEGEKECYIIQPPPASNMGVPATIARKKYFPNPYPNGFYSGNDSIEPNGVGTPENYYAWTWGDALFVVLDAYREMNDTSAKPTGWQWSLGLPQYLWMKQTLENSNAKYKFVFAHHVRGEGRGGITNAIQNEWGGYQRVNGLVGDGYTFPTNRPAAQGWTKPIHQLFRDNQVSVFFQGHDHLFAHEVLDSITYQEVPMAADSTYEIGMLANASAYLSDTIKGTGHLKVTVSPAYATIDFVRAYLPADTLSGLHHNREIAFSYNVRAKNTYTFIGTGNWSLADNWVNKAIPPLNLPQGYSIYINPREGGFCRLDVNQTITGTQSNLIVMANKNLIISGALTINQ
ncbi:MAG: hypothetical protein RLY16_2541 [Bacteroidota bacterium]